MRKAWIPLLTGTVLLCSQLSVRAQELKEHIVKEFTLQKEASLSTLGIYNLNGFIRVEGYAGDKVTMEIDKIISADDAANLEIGKKEFRLAFEQTGDSIIAYIAEPWDSRPRRINRHNYNDRDDIEYRYELSFTVKVPFAMNLDVSTVNHGNVDVKDVAGSLNVHNVNGSVTIDHAKGTTNARTVNGSVVVNYASNPPGPSFYHTINGDIKVNYMPGFSADLEFKSMHGQFYTDFSDAALLPVNAVKNEEKRGDGTVYRINKITTVRFGTGGKIFKFETLNGSVYIKKQS